MVASVSPGTQTGKLANLKYKGNQEMITKDFEVDNAKSERNSESDTDEDVSFKYYIFYLILFKLVGRWRLLQYFAWIDSQSQE